MSAEVGLRKEASMAHVDLDAMFAAVEERVSWGGRSCRALSLTGLRPPVGRLDL